MFWKRDNKTIVIEGFDAEGGRLIYRCKMPIEKLPPSFEARTTLHVRERDYDVVRAEPMTAEQWRRTGKLRLVLREVKISTADPAGILYSLPTVSEEWPPIQESSTKLGRRVLELHEDDWRQIEFASLSFSDAIDGELADIRHIHEHHRRGPGFEKTHARKRLIAGAIAEPRPLLSDLLSRLERATPLDGIAVVGAAGLVANGFAIDLLCGLQLYGLTAPDGRMGVLCLSYAKSNNALDRDLPALASFMRDCDLCLVDWCRVARIEPDESALREYLDRT
jgi:hypothetical protein